MVMRKIVDGLFKPIFLIARELFPYALIIYLILFLLENLFIGIVSNNFSLNWVLGVVLGLGLLSALAPDISEEQTEQKPQRNDYLLVIVMAIIGGVVIFAKLEATGWIRWITAGVSAGLVALVGIVLLGDDKEEITEEITPRESSLEQPVRQSDWLKLLRRVGRRFLIYRVRLPLVYVLTFVVLTAFLVPQNVVRLTERLWRLPALPQPTEETILPAPSPYFWDDYNSAENLSVESMLPVTILNGGAEKGSAASASAILRKNGYSKVSVGNAQRYDYTDVILMFKTEDKAQASIIKRLLSPSYPMIIETPAEATESGITLILGSKE